MSKRRRQLMCSRLMTMASKAFHEGDSAEGRKLYHEAAKRGCRSALTLDGTVRKAPRRKRRRGRR